MRLGSQMQNRVRLVPVEHRTQGGGIGNIRLNEFMPGMIQQIPDGIQVSGVSQPVYIGYLYIRSPQTGPNQVGTNEPSPAGNQQFHGIILIIRGRRHRHWPEVSTPPSGRCRENQKRSSACTPA